MQSADLIASKSGKYSASRDGKNKQVLSLQERVKHGVIDIAYCLPSFQVL